jgi:predicted flavoprotein YhiN
MGRCSTGDEVQTKETTTMKKLTLILATLGLAAVASASESYRVTLYQNTQINGKTFKPGDIKLDVENGNVVVKQGKVATETKAKVEEGQEKFLRTTVGVDGDTKAVKEIRLGGTAKTLVFAPAATASGNE